MTEQEIVRECLKLVRAKRSFSVCRTTYDQMVAEGVQDEIARQIEERFGLEKLYGKAVD